MTEVPKIVHDRLASGPALIAPQRAHPDANLLSAFAEQALAAAERDAILRHLAFCEYCRDVVSFALPTADGVAGQVSTSGPEEHIQTTESEAGAPALHKMSYAWPGLRWAALAGGVAVVAGVLLVRPGKLNQLIPPSAQPTTVATNASSDSGTRIATPSTERPTLLAKAGDAQPQAEVRPSNKLKSGQPAAPPNPTMPGMLVSGSDKQPGSARKLAGAAAPNAGADYAAPASRGSSEAVEVSTASEVLATAPSPEDSLMARNETPAIEKAKPAPPGTEDANALKGIPDKSQAKRMMAAARQSSSANDATGRNITWEIRDGVLLRSMNSGQNWQNAFRTDRPLLCYAARGDDIWAGGQAGALFHSGDGGVSWVRAGPSKNNRQLTSDITKLTLGVPHEIVISTSNNETWRSVDGGITWDNK